MLRASRRLMLLAAGLLALTPVQAGGIGVSPMRLVFDHGRGFGQLTLTNVSQETLAVETQVMPWPADADQQSGRDIVVNPPLATLAPGARVTLRVGLLRRPPADRERTYRLYVTELPTPMAPGMQGIGVRLRMGIPIFVAAQQPDRRPLSWQAQRDEQGWLLRAHNPGNVHQRVLELKAGAGEGQLVAAVGSPYVLPAAVALFRLPASLPLPAAGEPLALQVQTDHGRERVEIVLP